MLSGIKEIKAVMADAERLRRMGRRTILFVDEIHRFNKAQQDAFLPYVERGDIILIGATTENPSFEVISALLSRSKVYALRALTVPEIVDAAEARADGRGWANLERATRRTAGADRHLLPTATRAPAYNTLEAAAAASPGGELDRGSRAGRHAAQGAALRQVAAKSTST